jgi:hypothetical protein
MEGVKRAFWTAYTLDKYMSGMLGRPQALNDEDIDQVRPYHGLGEIETLNMYSGISLIST